MQENKNVSGISEIRKTLTWWCEPGACYELRVKVRETKITRGGFFTDLGALATEAFLLSESPEIEAVWLTLNPVNPELLALADNRVRRANPKGGCAEDDHILRRRLMMIDADSVKMVAGKENKNVSATAEEYEAAVKLAGDIRDYLTSEGFPAPVVGGSGNGGHLLHGIDMPNDPGAAELLERFYGALRAKFGAAIDPTVFNAARVCKLYPTMTRKGDATATRPWRKSELLSVPDDLQVVPVELIQKIAASSATTTSTSVPSDPPGEKKADRQDANKKTGNRQDTNKKADRPGPHTVATVERLMSDLKMAFPAPSTWKDGLLWELAECPFADNHTNGSRGEAAVTLVDGWVGFKCQHAHCADKKAADVFGPDVNVVRVAGQKSDKNKSKFDEYARAFYNHYERRGEHLLYANGRTYRYQKNRYAELDELPMDVREFFKTNGWSQSNNVVGNVVPIVQSFSRHVGGTMPFWRGECPFKDVRAVVAFGNGLLDLDDPRALLPHSPDWCSTVCLPFDYDPTARCPTWERFLTEAFDGDQTRIDLLQEFFGYVLTTDTSLQKALVLVGKPRSGKGTVQRTLSALVGKDSATGFSLDRFASEFGLSALVGKTVALVGEVELSGNQHKSKIVEVLKSVVGEDEVSVNTKHDPKIRSQRLTIRFVVASNTVPRLMDSSGALAHRLLFLPFDVSFVGREDVGLEQKLSSELPGIANWALDGLARLRANGGRFTLGDGHNRLAGMYAADTTPVLKWLKDCMVVSRWADPGDLPDRCLTKETVTISKSAAYQRYVEWCEVNDVDPPVQKWFGRDLKTILPKLKESQSGTGGKERSYRGLGVRPVATDPKAGGGSAERPETAADGPETGSETVSSPTTPSFSVLPATFESELIEEEKYNVEISIKNDGVVGDDDPAATADPPPAESCRTLQPDNLAVIGLSVSESYNVDMNVLSIAGHYRIRPHRRKKGYNVLTFDRRWAATLPERQRDKVTGWNTHGIVHRTGDLDGVIARAEKLLQAAAP